MSHEHGLLRTHEGGGEAGNIDRCGRVSLMVKINGMNIEGKHSEK